MDEPASSLVVVGASAGGVEALTTLAAARPGTWSRLPQASPWSELRWRRDDSELECALVVASSE